MIEIEVWSDVVCPFCYIGKRNFEKALAASGNASEVKVVFRSFELDPSAEKSRKISIYEVLAEKYGRTVEWAKQANENVKATGASVGLKFEMEKVIPSNSFDAHRLIKMADTAGLQNAVVEALFAAYFTEGKDIADHQVLAAIGENAGLRRNEVEAVLGGEVFSAEVRNEERQARELDIRGVPFFVFDKRLAVSGAQPPEVFAEALEQAFGTSG